MAAADPLVLGNGLSRVSHHLTVGLSRWTGTRGRIRVIAESGHFSATFVDSLTTICIKARVQTQHCELGGVHKSFCYSDRGAPIAGFGRFCQVFRFFASPSPAGALFDSRNDRLPVNWFTPFRIEALLRMSSDEGTGLLKTQGISFSISVTGCCGVALKERRSRSRVPLARIS